MPLNLATFSYIRTPSLDHTKVKYLTLDAKEKQILCLHLEELATAWGTILSREGVPRFRRTEVTRLWNTAKTVIHRLKADKEIPINESVRTVLESLSSEIRQKEDLSKYYPNSYRKTKRALEAINKLLRKQRHV